jgi:hypothetical protein
VAQGQAERAARSSARSDWSQGIQKPFLWHVGELGAEEETFLQTSGGGLPLEQAGIAFELKLKKEEALELNPVL